MNKNNNSNLTKQYHLNIYLENELINKIKEIAKNEHRCIAEEVRYILKLYSEKYFSKK